eukprot:SAG31_NODE_136_length_23089_cov_8.825924_8_plen_100_part_00
MSDTGIKTQMCMEGRGPAGTAVGTSHESLRTWDIEEVDMFASEPQTDEKSAKVELMDFHKIFGGGQLQTFHSNFLHSLSMCDVRWTCMLIRLLFRLQGR